MHKTGQQSTNSDGYDKWARHADQRSPRDKSKTNNITDSSAVPSPPFLQNKTSAFGKHQHLPPKQVQSAFDHTFIFALSFYEIRWDFWNNGSLVPCSLMALVMSLLYGLHLMNLASCLHKWPCCQAVQFGTTISLAVGSKSRYSLTLWSEPLDLPVVASGAEEQETRISPCSAIGVGSFP